MTTIYHNPRCRKSRETLTLLQENGEDPQIILYLEEVPSEGEIRQLLDQLGISPMELIRKQESDWKENFKGKELTDQEIILAMHQYPKLIERPVVVKKGKAALGRPPENVLKIL
ncbi:arsenate reductase (glutaredoxin) [Aureitalea marina]|uniref:Arsenate reductase (Glutaredoxin) n=1 Tax=Aureitalea marina TaxID=930804 RepID=A0A2S7KPG9_9FLAO|nr:arsenate reductase (glutaredoxin) [Aureitalea marina]PQB04515.1 arsenate reductase (glutaredoxin) [Aureitalea marina]